METVENVIFATFLVGGIGYGLWFIGSLLWPSFYEVFIEKHPKGDK
jgi:hypothetical protein